MLQLMAGSGNKHYCETIAKKKLVLFIPQILV